jgi:hypothetical protein
MAITAGIQFEWAIFHLVAKANSEKFKNNPNTKRAEAVYANASNSIKKEAISAIKTIESKFGKITNIEKNGKGKADLIITTRTKTLKCSVKYGSTAQLSSASLPTTNDFIYNVVAKYKNKGNKTQKQAREIITVLAEMNAQLPAGIERQTKIKSAIDSQESLVEKLKEILGSRAEPVVSDEYKKIKEVIVREAITGETMFKGNPKFVADWILENSSLNEINASYIRDAADRTSVRLSMKGRGKLVERGKIHRLDEIAIRFDYSL